MTMMQGFTGSCWCWALIALASFIHLPFAVEAIKTTKMQFSMPKTLEKDGGYEHQVALFGEVPLTGSMRARVYYTQVSLCTTMQTISASYLFPRDDSSADIISPFILMLDRDQKCTFGTKVINAQRLGADGVIIADNIGDTSTPLPIMADLDGLNSAIEIPSFLITKHDSDAIKTVMKEQNRVVRVQIDFGVSDPKDRVVDYKFWFQPGEKSAFRFVTEFKDIVVALGDRVSFTPFYPISDGTLNACRPSSTTSGYDTYGNAKKVLMSDCSPSFSCTNGGRYCVFESDLFPFVSGADLVAESLRRLCIWDQHQIGLKWWDYIREFAVQCHSDAENPALFTSKDCIEKIYEQVGIDGSKIDLCMQYNGGLADDTVNTMLEKQLANRPGVVPYSLIDNRYELYDATDPEDVFLVICEEFPSEDKPLACNNCVPCNDWQDCLKNGGVCKSSSTPQDTEDSSQENSHATLSVGQFLLLPLYNMLVALLLLVVGLLGYRHISGRSSSFGDCNRAFSKAASEEEEGENEDLRTGQQVEFDQVFETPETSSKANERSNMIV